MVMEIQPWKYDDLVTGNELEISRSKNFTKLRVNNRDYYFRSDDGSFDGTGTDLTMEVSERWPSN